MQVEEESPKQHVDIARAPDKEMRPERPVPLGLRPGRSSASLPGLTISTYGLRRAPRIRSVLATTHHAPIIEIGSSQSLRRQGRIGCARNSGDQIVNIPVEPGQRTATSSLAELVQLAGLPASAVDSVEITGAGDPVLPTRYKPVAPGSAVMAATGLAAAELWALKTGKRQRVRLDTRAAAAALRSPKFVMINGRKPEE